MSVSRGPKVVNVNMSARAVDKPDEEENEETYRLKRLNKHRKNVKGHKKGDIKLSPNVRHTTKSNGKVTLKSTQVKSDKSLSSGNVGLRNDTEHNEGIDDTEYDGRIDTDDDTEYTGTGRKKDEKKEPISIKGIASAVLFYVMLFVKMVAIAMGKILIVIAIVVVLVVVATVTLIENATYNFIVDEELHIRELVSNVTYELTNTIEATKNENECDVIISSGELAEWKEIIALWWTLKTHLSESEEWENYFTSDQEDIKYLFYQFNHIEYVVEEETEEDGAGRKILRVNITTTSLDELREHWGLDASQNTYLDNLLANEEIWKELLGTTELSSIAMGELGNSVSKYSDWYGTEGDTAVFITWCMNQAGLINGTYITGSSNADELKQELFRKGFIDIMHDAEEGDIIFIKANDKLDAGIVTRIEDDMIYVAFGGINGKSYVEESVYDKTSSLIDSYAHISDFFVESITANSLNMFSWPVDGYYYVTSAFGSRELEGTTFHHGLDIGCPEGTGILAGASGKVMIARYNSSLGYYIVIDHGGGVWTTYGHNSELLVEVGDKVNKGQRIAKAGNTGFSFGSHCHFAVQINGEYVNPASYLGLPDDFVGDAARYVR
ncbi:MAG: M23 family metallopeptidase [Lachnospiraceae bacterium]|nr:M23 family metallopeptidase [Lachnospiraceae bacterium]